MWQRSLCRACTNSCPVQVNVEQGRLTSVRADPDDPIYQGFICARGLNQPAYYNHPQRLLRPMKRLEGGEFADISSAHALDEIAERLAAIRDRHGPRSIAAYWGTMTGASPLTIPMMSAFLNAVGSPMNFSASTLDKPGRPIAAALHGRWMAPRQCYDRPDAGLLIGLNPLISFQGVPMGHPAYWLRDQLAGGMDLIVIDPRRTETARRATLHLQPRPGYDALLLAAMARTIIAEKLYDSAFVADNVCGLGELAQAVEPFDAGAVALAAGVDADALVKAARIFGSARRGYAAAGTGPSMSGPPTLTEYLVLCLDTLCGHWLRAGEQVPNPGVLLPPRSAIAQAAPRGPAFDFGEKMRVRGLANSAAGMPTAALPEEILLEGEGQVRALISCAGNPANAWPDEARARQALGSLDLLVQIDPWMSETSRLAHYVIPPKMAYETPGTTLTRELIGTYATPALSWDHPWGEYYPPVMSPPEDSDLLEEWEVMLGLIRRLGGEAIFVGAAGPDYASRLDPEQDYSSDDLTELYTRGSRVPLEVVRESGGAFFAEPPIVVRDKEPGWTERLDVGNIDMMDDLGGLSGQLRHKGEKERFRLVCRRTAQAYNSSSHPGLIGKGRTDNPAHLHPDDMAALGLAKGSPVLLRSAHGAIAATAEPDPALRRGLVSISHGFGQRSGDERLQGSNVNALLHMAEGGFERYSGLPRMSNVEVEVLIQPT